MDRDARARKRRSDALAFDGMANKRCKNVMLHSLVNAAIDDAGRLWREQADVDVLDNFDSDPHLAAFVLGNMLVDAAPTLCSKTRVVRCTLVLAGAIQDADARTAEMCAFALCNAVGTRMLPPMTLVSACRTAGQWIKRRECIDCQLAADTTALILAAIGQAMQAFSVTLLYKDDPFALVEPAFSVFKKRVSPEWRDTVYVSALQCIVLWWGVDDGDEGRVAPGEMLPEMIAQYHDLQEHVRRVGVATLSQAALLRYGALDNAQKMFAWAEDTDSANAKMLLAAHVISLVFDGSTQMLEIAYHKQLFCALMALIRSRVSKASARRLLQDIIGNLIEYPDDARDVMFNHLVEECGILGPVMEMIVDLANDSTIAVEKLSSLLFFIERGMEVVEGFRVRVLANARLEAALAVLQAQRTDADVVGRVGSILESLSL